MIIGYHIYVYNVIIFIVLVIWPEERVSRSLWLGEIH